MEAFAVLFALGVLCVTIILPIVAIAVAVNARARIRAAEQTLAALADAKARLEGRLRILEREQAPTQQAEAESHAAAAPPQPERAAAMRAAGAPAGSATRPAVAPFPVVHAPAVPAVAKAGSTAPGVTSPAPVAPVTMPTTTPVTTPAAPPAPAPPREARQAAVQAPPSAPRPPLPPASARPVFDWESLVGVKLFSWIAGIALVVAAVFFLRYSIDHGWLGPTMRMALGLLTGIGLLVACELKGVRRYRVTADALDGAAIAVLFSTFFAAHVIWKLIPSVPTFLLMTLVTIAAVLLAIRHDSLFIALLGLAGGFATPTLLSTGENQPVRLFGYLLLLNVGLALVAHRKRWPVLTALSLIATTLYQWTWVFKRLDEGQLALAAGIFLVFPTAAAITFATSVRGDRPDPSRSVLERTNSASFMLATLLPLYMAAVPAYGQHPALLFGTLLVTCAGLAAVALWRGPHALHLAGGVAALVVLWTWLGISYTSLAWPGILLAVAALVALYLGVPVLARAIKRPLAGPAAHAAAIAPLALSALPILILRERATASPGLVFGVLLVLFAACSAFAIARRHNAVYLLAALAAIGTEIAWSGRFLSPDRLHAGLVIYALSALCLLAVPLLTRHFGNAFEPSESAVPVPGHTSFASAAGRYAYLSLVGLVFLLPVASSGELALPPWSWLAVLYLLGLALGAAALLLREPLLAIAACSLSQLVLLIFAGGRHGEPWPTVAVLAATAIGVLAIVWLPLTERHSGARAGTLARGGAIAAVVLAVLVTMVSTGVPGAPAFFLLLTALTVLHATVLWLATRPSWFALAPLAAGLATVVVTWWEAGGQSGEHWLERALLVTALWGVFVAYPLALGRRIGRAIEPHLAVVLYSVPTFYFLRESIKDLGLERMIGVLPIVQAIVMVMLLAALLRLEPPTDRTLGRLALVAGTALAFVTAAVPLQLDKEWITLAWALEAAALAWLYTRVPHRGLALTGGGLALAVFVRLALNPAVLSYHPHSDTPIFNWYLYTYLVAAAALFLAAYFFARTDDLVIEGLPRLSRVMPALATILLFLLVNIEIADYFSTGPTLTFRLTGGTLSMDLAYTLAWALFAIGLLVVGVVLTNRATRIASIALLAVTVLKAFLHDLARLEGLYRVASFIGLAISLALVAVALQRFVLTKSRNGEGT
jgi:uncharacterized membrane protein